MGDGGGQRFSVGEEQGLYEMGAHNQGEIAPYGHYHRQGSAFSRATPYAGNSFYQHPKMAELQEVTRHSSYFAQPHYGSSYFQHGGGGRGVSRFGGEFRRGGRGPGVFGTSVWGVRELFGS